MEDVLEHKPVLEVKLEDFVERPSEESSKEAYDRVLAFEHLDVVKKLGNSQEIYKALSNVEMPEEVRVKLADVIPVNKDVVKMIFYQFTYTVDDAVINQVFDIIQEHVPKKGKKKGGK